MSGNNSLDAYKKYGAGAIAGAISAGVATAIAATGKPTSTKPATSITSAGSTTPTGGTSASGGTSNPQMSALEKNYEMQSQNALSKYESASKELEKSRDRAVQNAGANNAKLMKYMPSILKRQGLSGLGVSQSAVINANNNFAGQLTEIEDNYQKNSADLLANYNDAKLAYDTQFNTQKAQLEQAALDKEEAERKELEAKEDAKKNEIAGNLEAMINGSAATTIDELVSELGITLGEGQDFNAYVDSLGIDAHDASYLKSLAAQKVSANLTAAGDKTKAELEALFEENYKMAYDAIVNDSMTTDFSEYLGKFVAGENISESQLSNLMYLAQSQAAKNAKELASPAEAEGLARLDELEYEGDYKGALSYLEMIKGTISQGIYDSLKAYYETKIGDGDVEGGILPENPNQTGAGYENMTQEQKDELITSGTDFLSINGRDYLFKEAVDKDSTYFTNNADFKSQLKDLGYNNHNSANIPNGTIISFRARAGGHLSENDLKILKVDAKPYSEMTAEEKALLSDYDSAFLTKLSQASTVTLVRYNNQWYLAEDKGETMNQEGNAAANSDPFGVYKPYTVPQYASDSNVLNSIFDKYKQ